MRRDGEGNQVRNLEERLAAPENISKAQTIRWDADTWHWPAPSPGGETRPDPRSPGPTGVPHEPGCCSPVLGTLGVLESMAKE